MNNDSDDTSAATNPTSTSDPTSTSPSNDDNTTSVETTFDANSQVYIYGSDDHYNSSKPFDNISSLTSIDSLNSELKLKSIDLLSYYTGINKDKIKSIKPSNISLIGSYLYLSTEVVYNESTMDSSTQSSIGTFLLSQFRDGWGLHIFNGTLSSGSTTYRLSLWDPLSSISWIKES